MVKDKEFSRICICPETGKILDYTYDVSYKTPCKHCGDMPTGELELTHHEIIVGKWVRPSIIGWLLGQREYFEPKNKEDGYAFSN